MTEPFSSQNDDASEPKGAASNDASTSSASSGTSAAGASDHQHDAVQHAPSSETVRAPANIMVLRPQPSDGPFFDEADGSSSKADPGFSAHRGRRLAALVAVAAICGAAGGSLTTVALGHMFTAPAPKQMASADELAVLKDAVARINADVNGVKADMDRAGKTRTAQIGKLGERLDKIEKSQEDTSLKIAKVSEAQTKIQDKAPDKVTVATASAAPEATGSIAPASAGVIDTRTAAIADTKIEPKKPPIVEGWTSQPRQRRRRHHQRTGRSLRSLSRRSSSRPRPRRCGSLSGRPMGCGDGEGIDCSTVSKRNLIK